MAEVINLRQARKRAAKAGREREAEANRLLHAMPAKTRKAAAREAEQSRLRHEAHRLERNKADTGEDAD
ncbi:MAG: DUF4169 family protein [Nitratireductor sp.]|nr:DUF4169 family protein [Nitratireductor sp.]